MTVTPLLSVPAAPNPRVDSVTPYLQLDIGAAVMRFGQIAAAFGADAVHYATKANPHPALIAALVGAGSRFDVASPAEVDLCLAAGADPSHLVYSNPIKRRADIAYAAGRGVSIFAADTVEEVAKLADAAPGAAVLARLATTGAGSDWPLSGKFGCAKDDLVPLLRFAAEHGLRAAGVSFHVGSQQCDPQRWEAPIAQAAAAYRELRAAGLRPWLLDIGGGWPAAHEGDFPCFETYVETIHRALDAHVVGPRPRLIIEPGRGLVGDAGALVTEVVGVSWRGGRRWVYLDAGIYSGLVETLGEAIRYRLTTDRDDDERGPVVLAGPTCDSVDVLYERTPVQLPVSLREGDRVVFGSAGAYTSSYSTVGFNGFPPLPTVLI
ncbi:MAG TPA: type III PLP-dependent enzyme [Propionibacteriaceae bacterium]|nr:type III PLP-dependent enzyme [Propionibacteriaceae bacterium]